jgi:hypothetical protein
MIGVPAAFSVRRMHDVLPKYLLPAPPAARRPYTLFRSHDSRSHVARDNCPSAAFFPTAYGSWTSVIRVLCAYGAARPHVRRPGRDGVRDCVVPVVYVRRTSANYSIGDACGVGVVRLAGASARCGASVGGVHGVDGVRLARPSAAQGATGVRGASGVRLTSDAIGGASGVFSKVCVWLMMLYFGVRL